MSKGKLYLKKKRKNRGFALRSLSLLIDALLLCLMRRRWAKSGGLDSLPDCVTQAGNQRPQRKVRRN